MAMSQFGLPRPQDIVKLTVFETDQNGIRTKKKIKEGHVCDSGSVFDQISNYLSFLEWDDLILYNPELGFHNMYIPLYTRSHYRIDNSLQGELTYFKKKIDLDRRMDIFLKGYYGYELALWKVS
jgi:hypothetical protein